MCFAGSPDLAAWLADWLAGVRARARARVLAIADNCYLARYFIEVRHFINVITRVRSRVRLAIIRDYSRYYASRAVGR